MVFVEFCLSIPIQEFIGRNLQMLLQTYNIVRGQHQIESSTTMSETLNALVALKVKRGGVYRFEYDLFLGGVYGHEWLSWLREKLSIGNSPR